jgi:hypothetical protein
VELPAIALKISQLSRGSHGQDTRKVEFVQVITTDILELDQDIVWVEEFQFGVYQVFRWWVEEHILFLIKVIDLRVNWFQGV